MGQSHIGGRGEREGRREARDSGPAMRSGLGEPPSVACQSLGLPPNDASQNQLYRRLKDINQS